MIILTLALAVKITAFTHCLLVHVTGPRDTDNSDDLQDSKGFPRTKTSTKAIPAALT